MPIDIVVIGTLVAVSAACFGATENTAFVLLEVVLVVAVDDVVVVVVVFGFEGILVGKISLRGPINTKRNKNNQK